MSSFITCKKSQSFPWAKHLFFYKIQNGAKRYVGVVYFNAIPHFYMIFKAEFISEEIDDF